MSEHQPFADTVALDSKARRSTPGFSTTTRPTQLPSRPRTARSIVLSDALIDTSAGPFRASLAQIVVRWNGSTARSLEVRQ